VHGGGASKWNMKDALLSLAEVAGTPSTKRRTTKASKVGWGREYQTRTATLNSIAASGGANGGEV